MQRIFVDIQILNTHCTHEELHKEFVKYYCQTYTRSAVAQGQ